MPWLKWVALLLWILVVFLVLLLHCSLGASCLFAVDVQVGADHVELLKCVAVKWNRSRVLCLQIQASFVSSSKSGRAGASQIKGFRPLLEKTFPSIYLIFRAYQNTNRWSIINKMFVKSQPVDARVMFFLQGGAFSLSLAVASCSLRLESRKLEKHVEVCKSWLA